MRGDGCGRPVSRVPVGGVGHPCALILLPPPTQTPEGILRGGGCGRPVSRVLSSDGERFTVALRPARRRLGNHLSGPARHRGARAAYPGLKESEPPPARRRASPLLGLAPGGGCLAAGIAAGAGGLLHHLFTLTPAEAGAVVFCGPLRGFPRPGVTRHRALRSADFPQTAHWHCAPSTCGSGQVGAQRRCKCAPPAIARPALQPPPS